MSEDLKLGAKQSCKTLYWVPPPTPPKAIKIDSVHGTLAFAASLYKLFPLMG